MVDEVDAVVDAEGVNDGFAWMVGLVLRSVVFCSSDCRVASAVETDFVECDFVEGETEPLIGNLLVDVAPASATCVVAAGASATTGSAARDVGFAGAMDPLLSFEPAASAPIGALDEATPPWDASAAAGEREGAALDELSEALPRATATAGGAVVAAADGFAYWAPSDRLAGWRLLRLPAGAVFGFVAGVGSLSLLLVVPLELALLSVAFDEELDDEFDEAFDDEFDEDAEASADELLAESAARCRKPLNKSFAVVDCDGANFKATVESVAAALALLSIFAGVIVVRFEVHALGCVSFRSNLFQGRLAGSAARFHPACRSLPES